MTRCFLVFDKNFILGLSTGFLVMLLIIIKNLSLIKENLRFYLKIDSSKRFCKKNLIHERLSRRIIILSLRD